MKLKANLVLSPLTRVQGTAGVHCTAVGDRYSHCQWSLLWSLLVCDCMATKCYNNSRSQRQYHFRLVPRPPRTAFVVCSTCFSYCKRQKLCVEAWERGYSTNHHRSLTAVSPWRVALTGTRKFRTADQHSQQQRNHVALITSRILTLGSKVIFVAG